jgi:hypothetical protein
MILLHNLAQQRWPLGLSWTGTTEPFNMTV